MNMKIKAIIGLFSFALMLATAFVAYNALLDTVDAPDNITGNTGALQRAPDFVMEDGDGNEIWLSDFLGQPIVLNFWATWCPACVQETPHFENLYQNSNGEIKVLKVNLITSRRETRDAVDAFMEAGGYSFPLYFDITGEGAMAYSVQFIPITFFINPEGYVAAKAQGAVDESILNNGVNMILS